MGGFENTASGASCGVYASYLSTSSGTNAACIGCDQATASGESSVCVGSAGGNAAGIWSAVVGGTGGIAGGENSVSISGGSAPNDNDIAVGTAASLISFFGAVCVAQQGAGGTGIAGPAYTANEQQMLQAVYTALKNLGLIA